MPTVAEVKPTYVAAPGADWVTIVGSGFTGATRVLIGEFDASSFQVLSDTEVWAQTHDSYTRSSRVSVYVEGPGGRSGEPGEPGWLTLGDAPASSGEGESRGSPPLVSAVDPVHVAVPGTDWVTIRGSGFTGATRVLIGEFDASSFEVQSDTEVWAQTHDSYTRSSRVSVYVEGPGGRSGEPGEPGWLTLGDAPSS